MQNQEDTPSSPDVELIERAAKQLYSGGGLDITNQISSKPDSDGDAISDGQMTNDDVYDFIQGNRDRSFDTTTPEGELLYLQFEEANRRRNKFTFENFKQMVGIIGSVPTDIINGIGRNLGRPDRIVASVADGVARDMRDLVGLLTQSEDPSSPLFWAKDLIAGTGTVKSRMEQFNEARWWGNRSNELEEGKADILSEWVPDNYKETARNLIDRKFANALSYIGLDAPHMIRNAWKRKGLGGMESSIKAFKNETELYQSIAKDAVATEDWFNTNAEKFAKLSKKLTGEAIVGTAEVVSKPFELIKERILRGSEEIETRVGHIPNEISNGATTLMSDTVGSVAKNAELGPFRGILFSLGVKPIAEYASVFGNELIDAANGVVSMKGGHVGQDLLGRLALNGGRISMSKEAQVVAKFTNVVVGWPASMAFPTFKRAVGDAAYMGLLGYANARGEGASSGVGVGFAWGGLSGALRHVHNVYNHSIAHQRIIENFDDAQLPHIYKQNPKHAEEVRAFLKFVDSKGDRRVSATVRAQLMAGHAADAKSEIRYRTANEMEAEFGVDRFRQQVGGEGRGSKGGDLFMDGKNIIWLNRDHASPETLVHEYSHRFLDILFKRNDNSAQEAIRAFFGVGTNTGEGPIPDVLKAIFIGEYSKDRFKLDDAWMNGDSSAATYTDKNGNVQFDNGYGNKAYALEQIKEIRRRFLEDPKYMFSPITRADGSSTIRLFDEHPIAERLMHEVFAYNQSNSLLRKSPDIFLRNPSFKTIRSTMENWFTLLNQRKVNDLESAGVLIRKKKAAMADGTDKSDTLMESIFWDDGKFMSMGLLDSWSDQVMKDVLRHGDVSVMTLSGDRLNSYMNQNGKQRFMNGGRIKTKKEIEAQITADADKIATTLDSLPDAVKPKWSVVSNGTKRIRMTELSVDAWKAIEDSGIYSKAEFDLLKGMSDVIAAVDAGKPVFNTFTGQYLGNSKQVVEAALGERLKGRQVPITLRHFAPFSIELIVSKFDELGNPIPNPRSHVTVHAMDVGVLNKRKMNQWQKSEVKSLFRDFGHFSETFVYWFEQHSMDASQRKPSADYLRPEFGANAERVRDIMYETWGGRKRNDESYINAPEGYAGGRDGPLYPIHSLRFDLLANVLKQSQVFPEAFGGNLITLRYHEGVAYEPMRRNAMVGSFVQRDLTNGRRFYADGNGYEIRGEEPKLKLFNMFGNLVGVFKTMAKAQSAAEKDLKRQPKEEVGLNSDDFGDAPIVDRMGQFRSKRSDVYAGRSNLMLYRDRNGEYVSSPLKINHLKVQQFVNAANNNTSHNNYDQNYVTSVKLKDLIDGSKEWSDVLGSAFDELEVTHSPLAGLYHGGVVYGLRASGQAMRQFGVEPSLLQGKGIESFRAYVALHLQSMIAIKQKDAFAMRTALASHDADFMHMVRFSNMMNSLYEQFRADQTLDNSIMSPMANLEDFEKFSKWAEETIAEANEKGALDMLFDETPPQVPSWASGTIIDSSGNSHPRFAHKLFQRLNMSALDANGNTLVSPLSMMPDAIKADLNDWACTMAESFMKGKSWTYKVGTMSVTSLNYADYEMPQSVKNFLQTVGQGQYPTFYLDQKSGTLVQNKVGHLNKWLQRWKTDTFHLHSVTKVGDRDAVKNQHKPLNELFIKTNQATAKDTIGTIATGFIGSDAVEFDAEDANTPLQALRVLTGSVGMRSFIVIDDAGAYQKGQGQARFSVSMNEVTLMGAHNSEFNATTNKNDLVAGRVTTEPARGLTNPLHSLLGENGVVEMPTDVIASSLGVLPFSGIRKSGSLRSHYDNGWHLSNIAEVAGALQYPVNPSQDFTMAGLQNLANNIFVSGIDSAEKMYLHQVVTGAMQVEMGRSVINGDPTNIYGKIGSLNGGKGINANITDFGQGLVDRGYAMIIHAAVSASLGSAGINPKNKLFGDSSILSAAFSTKGISGRQATLNRKLQQSVRMVVNEMKNNGWETEKVSKIYGGPANLMLGGMRARELDMIKTGAMRFVKTDSGKMYKAFEFSDKDATLLTDKVGGKLHLLPFSKGGEADFDAYYKDFMRSQAPLMSTDALKLGELIDHKILFAHYPSLKDVRVEWEYGYGAHYNSDADVITLGIDRYIGKAMHERGSPDHLDYASFGIDFERKALDTILHEIQHAIQYREQWTDSASTASSVILQKAGLILANNIVGVAGRTLSTSRAVNDSGRVFFTDDPSSAPTQFDNRQIIQSIVKMAGSPMHLHLRQYAYPNLIKVAEESMLGLADAHMHHPPEHMSRINAEKLSKKIGVVRGRAIEAMEAFKRGDLREAEAKDVVCEHVMELENLIESGVGMLSIENSPVADRLYNSMSNSLKYMRRSMQALNAFQIISKMADSGTAGMDVGAFSAKAREVFDSVSMMQYLSQRHEIEADLTERRSQMTQEELNATGIDPNMTRANGLDAISGAMDIGYAGNSIRAIGMALKNKSPIRVANLMVGGTGDAKLKPEERSNDALKLMGRGALVSWVVKTLENELQQLNAVAVYGRGWEVGKDGVPRLTFKQGIIRVKGNIAKALDKKSYIRAELGGHGVPETDEFTNASLQQQGDYKLGIFNAIAKDGQTTITLQDIARIIDGIVINESELATPTEAMDIIIRDDFPSVIEVKNLPKLLKDKGISEDGLNLSNAVLFSQMNDSDLPQTVTKGELIDIMAIVHRQLVHERTASRSVASGVIGNAKFDVSGVTPVKLLAGVDKAYAPSGYYDDDDPVRKFADVIMGRMSFPDQFGAKFQTMGPQSGDNPRQNRFGILNLNYTSGEATLNPVRPEWIEPDVWGQLVEKWQMKGYLDVGFFGMKQSLTDTDAERVMRESVLQRANMLNRSLNRKLFLLKPFYEQAIAKLQGTLDDAFDTSERNRFMTLKFSLLDEASLAMIEPDLAGFRSSQNYAIGANSHRQFGSGMHFQESHTMTSYETTRTANQLGIAPAIYASGYSPEVRDAFVELQTLMPVVGFSAESSIHAGMPTNYYRNIGGKEVQFYSLIDDLGDRNFTADQNIADNLLSITTSAMATKTLTEKVIATLSEGDDGMTREQLQPLRLLVSIAERASRLAESASVLVGDVQTSNKDYINRNVQREYSQSGFNTQNKFIQELSLLRGYRGADGALVVQENLMAETSAALAHTANIEIPVWNHSLAPAIVSNRNFSQPAVQAIVMKDLAARSILFGAINDGAGNVTRPMSYIAPLSELAASIAQTQNGGVYSELGVHIDGSVAYTSGIHALHSALYLASFEKGQNLSRPLTADSSFYTAWAQPNAENMFNKQHGGGHTIESFAIGLAPFLATAMTEKMPMLRQGQLVTGDILSVEQRALLKSAREAYKGYDFANKVTPEMDAARKAFFDTLDSQQINAIITHLSSGNVGYGLITMLGVMNAYQQIKKLPDAPNLTQAFGDGNDIRSELFRQLDLYLTEGRYVTEQGVNDVGGTVAMYDKGVTHQYIGMMTSSSLSDPITQNAILAAWSVMDSKATAYVPDMVNGEPDTSRPHASLMTYVSPRAYAYQPETFLATNTAVGSKFTHTQKHPARTHSLKAENTTPNPRETFLQPVGFKGEPMGLAEALFNVYDPVEINPAFNADLGPEGPIGQTDPLLGIHHTSVKARTNPISQTFIRKHVVDSIIAQAKRMKTDRVSIEPARYRLSGRSVAYRSSRPAEVESGSSSIKYKSHSAGYSALFEGVSMVPSKDDGVSVFDGFAENRPFMTNPMMGFAWKRLEDGRLVINMTGDHAGYKIGYLGRQYIPDDVRKKIPVGFSIMESLGYDPYTGDIAPPNVHLALYGGMSTANYTSEPAGMVQALAISGESWRKQIVKSARARILNGDAIRNRYEGVDLNKAGIVYKNSAMNVGFDVLMGEENAHNNSEALSMALSILGHRTGHQYMSLTLPANATPEMIRAVMHNVLIGNATSETYKILTRNTNNQLGMTIPHLGDGGAIYSALRSAASNIAPHDAHGVMSRIRALLSQDNAGSPVMDTEMMNEIIRKEATGGGQFQDSVLPVSIQDTAMKKRAEMVLGRNTRLLGDIESFAAMATRSDHGYAIPEAERHLTKNGDTTLAIELMFPNKPEMTKFAWDGKEDNGVSIVHRGPKAKPTGYFVTYDYQTGIDQYGNPITTKKVVPVKTLAEAENLRSQFGVVASKAILAQALVAAGMESPQVKQGVTNPDSNVDFAVQDGKVLRQNETGLAMVMSKKYHVGDFDKAMTAAEAKAVSQVLNTGTALQTKLPSVEVRKANLMIGGRDARELEGLLRRKLTFGNGSGPIEFSSKLMRVVAYGKKKTGRDLYPDKMTGAEWYKFLKENTVSKDEMRMTGIVHLLHENNDTPLTRQDLAEFIYTVYPRTSRQVRRQNNSTILTQNKAIKAGSMSGFYNLPFIDDVQTKETFVVNTHLDNLRKVADLIEQKMASEETKADAVALAASIKKSIDFTIAEMGMPPDALAVGNTDLKASIEYMRSIYTSSVNRSATTEGFYGDTRGVRPAQLEYVMRDAVWGRLSDQYKTIEAALGDLGFINPYEIIHADQFAEKNPFNPATHQVGSGLDEARSLHQGVSIMGSVNGPAEVTPNPSFAQQNVYFHGGNYHASYATFSGFYQSSPQFVEVTNRRLLEESNRAKATLKERMDHTNDPQQKRKIKSVIDTIERVEAVRKLVGGQVSDFSHYDNNDQGTFQLGHVRSTEAVLLGEYGIANPNEPAFHGEDPVSGYAYSPETVIGIEEIQSDSFQYHTFGPPNKAEMSLPDSPEQIEGLKLAGDLTKLVETKKRLEASVKEVQSVINRNLQHQMMSSRGDNAMNAMYLSKNLGALSAVELYMLKDDLKLKDTGRTMQVPEHYRQYVGMERIPVYELSDYMELRAEGKFEDDDSRNRAIALGRKMAVQIGNLASGDVLASLLPESVMGLVLGDDIFTYREDASSRPQPTPSFVFMALAAQDPEVINKSLHIAESQAAMRGATDVDWDAVAARTIDRIEAMKNKVLNDSIGRELGYLRDHAGPRASRLARGKFFDNLIQIYRERLASPRNRMLMADIMPTGDPMSVGLGEGYIDTPLSMEIRSNPSRFTLVSSSNDTGKMHPAQLLFPSNSMLSEDLSHNFTIDFRGTEIAPEPDGPSMDLGVQLVAANTALGQFVASSVSGLIAHISRMGTVPAEIKSLEVEIAKITPRVPISSGNAVKIANSLPYGVEDIYKPVALNGTILRAANAGFGAITYADARMQVLRGHSMDIVPTMLIGRQANMFTMSPDSHTAALMSQLHMIPEATRNQLHGGLFKRLAEADNQFFMDVFRRQVAFEHNGVSADIATHFVLAAKDAAPILLSGGIQPADMGVLTGFWRSVSESRDAAEIADGNLGRPHDAYGISGESSMIAPDGKPYKAKDLASEFFKRFYGVVQTGEKSDRQRVIDSAVANAGSSTFYWSEQGRAMGYVSQYGAPSWFIKSIMFGQKQAALDAFSTDAFQRPLVTIADDGTYTLMDPKSGRAIMEKIKDPTSLREAFFQNSRYLGRLPYIAKFMSEWSPVGGYVTQGHTSGRVYNSDNLKDKMDDSFTTGAYPKKNKIPFNFAGVVADATRTAPEEMEAGNSFSSSASKSMAPFGGVTQYAGAKAWMKHVNNVDVQDAEALSLAMSTYFSCGGPVMRFKPRNPTEAHKKAFRRKIVEGIAMLMPSNGGIGKPQANTETLEMLSRMYNNFTKVTKGRRIPTQGESLEDEDESRP